MLLRFRCRNFLSIRDEQTLSLVATTTRTEEHGETLLATPISGVSALRCAAIWGANASGKSNVLLAMSRFSGMVSDSWRAWKPTGGVPTWNPFLLDEDSREGNSEFEIDFVLNDEVLVYGFRFDQSCILEEWLMGSAGRKLYFRRWTDGTSVEVESPRGNLGSRTHLGEIERKTRPNSLFLSAAAQSAHPFLVPVFRWIDERFSLLEPTGMVSMPMSSSASCCKDENRKRVIQMLMSAVGTGVVDLQVEEEDAPHKFQKVLDVIVSAAKEVDPEMAEVLNKNPRSRQKVTFIHEGKSGKRHPLPFELESNGTRAFFQLMGPMIQELSKGGLLLIDEINSSMHPHLAAEVVKLFQSPVTNPKGAQLVFATHDSTLMTTGLLRRDEFWLAEKDAEGATSLRSISDYKVRKEKDLSAAYLKGQFGAIPVIDYALIQASVGRLIANEEIEAFAQGTK
jgi:AAA15 family ATPase/GTPase